LHEPWKHFIGEVKKQDQNNRAFGEVNDKVFREMCGQTMEWLTKKTNWRSGLINRGCILVQVRQVHKASAAPSSPLKSSLAQHRLIMRKCANTGPEREFPVVQW
jgi:hypothetical protein